MTAPPAIEAAGAGVWRTLPGGRRATLLADVDWRVEPGERWAVVGPNGAGKTTLLSLAGARLHPSDGTVAVLGSRLGAVDTRVLRTGIGHVDASMAGAFRPRATARDVVRTGATATIAPLHGDSAGAVADAADRVERLLAEVGCARLADNRFARLSRGEQQRILLARALVARPRLLLLDEPTSGLDLPGREAFLDRLDALTREDPGLAVVQVSHHLEELAASVTHALLLRAGRVVAGGPADEVLRPEPLSHCFDAPIAVVRRDGRRFAVIDRAEARSN